MHEFEVDVASCGVVERQQGPAVGGGRKSFEHLFDVGHFQVACCEAVSVDARRQEVLDRRQDSLLDVVQGVLALDLNAEYQVQVSVLHSGAGRGLGVVAHHISSGAAVHANVLHVHVEASTANLDGPDEVHQTDGEVWEVVVAVDLHLLVQN